MKFFKKDTPLDKKDRDNNRTMLTKWHDRISGIRRNMSRGAANIFRMIKTRGKWGNKQLWGTREGGKPTQPLDHSIKQKSSRNSKK